MALENKKYEGNFRVLEGLSAKEYKQAKFILDYTLTNRENRYLVLKHRVIKCMFVFRLVIQET